MRWLRCKNLGSWSLNFSVASHFYCKTNRWLSTLLRQITAEGSTAVSTTILKLYSRASSSSSSSTNCRQMLEGWHRQVPLSRFEARKVIADFPKTLRLRLRLRLFMTLKVIPNFPRPRVCCRPLWDPQDLCRLLQGSPAPSEHLSASPPSLWPLCSSSKYNWFWRALPVSTTCFSLSGIVLCSLW